MSRRARWEKSSASALYRAGAGATLSDAVPWSDIYAWGVVLYEMLTGIVTV
jgi:hypothetical protein